MVDLNRLRERFLKEEPKTRLGHLAADLARIATFVESGSTREARPILYSSKFLAEWAAYEVDSPIQSMLAEVQSYLALRELEWPNWSSDEAEIRSTARAVRLCADQLLRKAGFL